MAMLPAMRAILSRSRTTLATVAASFIGLSLSGDAAALTARETDYQDWRVRCETPDDGSPEQCLMFQGVSTANREARILNIVVRFVPDDATAIAYIAAPLGVYLPNGIAMSVDESNPLRLPFEFCNASGCHTRLKLEDKLLQMLKSGGSARFEIVQFTGGKQFTAVVSLKGFTAAFGALK